MPQVGLQRPKSLRRPHPERIRYASARSRVWSVLSPRSFTACYFVSANPEGSRELRERNDRRSSCPMFSGRGSYGRDGLLSQLSEFRQWWPQAFEWCLGAPEAYRGILWDQAESSRFQCLYSSGIATVECAVALGVAWSNYKIQTFCFFLSGVAKTQLDWRLHL